MNELRTVSIDLGERTYEVRIGPGLLSRAEEFLPWVGGGQVCVVTDQAVAPLYLDRVRRALRGRQVVVKILPPGESAKTLEVLEGVFDLLLATPCDRDVTLVALGGGVVGDIAGFAAACYQRGVAFIQAPTTLLAQVDSSVGGKTGVNHRRGKNMIGAFHQPRRVLADTGTLATLERRQFVSGLAEVIKYGVMADAKFFTWLERNIGAVMALDAGALAFAVQRSCINKAKIVEQDEREGGARALLNLGHTFAHAIETGTGYGEWLHGEAVATGIAMAAHLAAQLGRLSAADHARITGLLSAAGLPVGPFTGLPAADMLHLMKIDKKVRDGRVRLILPAGIGAADLVTDYPAQALARTVSHFTADRVAVPA